MFLRTTQGCTGYNKQGTLQFRGPERVGVWLNVSYPGKNKNKNKNKKKK